MNDGLVATLAALVALAAFVLGTSTWLAPRPRRAGIAPDQGPGLYRDGTGDAPDEPPSRAARNAARVVLAWGILLVVLVPGGVFIAFLESFSFEPNASKTTRAVFSLAATASALLVGPALVRFGVRARRGAATAPLITAALVVFQATLIAVATFAGMFDRFASSLPLMPSFVVFAITVAPAFAVRTAGAASSQDASRVAAGAAYAGFVLLCGAAVSLWLVDELGDRASVQPGGVHGSFEYLRTAIVPVAGAFVGSSVAAFVRAAKR